jgi:hypothetical protein
MEQVTVKEAAERLKMCQQRVRQLYREGRLTGSRIEERRGPVIMIDVPSIESYVPRPTGHPRKPDDQMTYHGLYARRVREQRKAGTFKYARQPRAKKAAPTP